MSNLEDQVLRYVYEQKEKHGITALTLHEICSKFWVHMPVVTIVVYSLQVKALLKIDEDKFSITKDGESYLGFLQRLYHHKEHAFYRMSYVILSKLKSRLACLH